MLYICNDKIHTRKSKVLNFFGQLKFDEEADSTADSILEARNQQCLQQQRR